MTATDVTVVVEQLRRRVPGGIGTYATGLLGGLAALGDPDLAVTLLASRPPPGRPDPLGDLGFAVCTSALPGPLLTRLWDRGRAAPRPSTAPAAGHRTGPGVLHATSLAFPAPRRLGGRPRALAVAVHDLSWRQHPAATTPRGRHWHEAGLARTARLADAVVVPSPAVADDLAGVVAPDRVSVIPHGADHLPAPDHTGAQALLAGLGVTGPYLLSVGTVEPRKNLTRLFAAYARARPQLPEPWPLVVVGPTGWGSGGLSAGPPDGVVAAGRVDDAVLAGLYAGARLLAYVPLTEGYGLPPVEAMAHGLPVVASTTVPSVRAMPADGAAGAQDLGNAALVVDPADTDALAGALVEAATDESSRLVLTAAGRALAGARTWRRCALGHLDLWRSLA